MDEREELAALRRMAELESRATGAPSQPTRSPSYTEGTQATPRQKNSYAQLQGPTFGFMDELAGLVGGGVKTIGNDKPFRQNYQETRDFVRGAADQGMRDEPWRNIGGQAALTLPLGMIGAAKAGGGIVAQTLAAMGIGGAQGFVNGIGASERSDLQGMGQDAVKGGAFGAAIPLIGMPVARTVGAVANNVATRFSDSSAMTHAKQKVVEALLRDAPKSSNAVAQASARMGTLGPESRIVDAGGLSVRGSLDTLATLPGETKNAVELAIRSRQASRGGRMIGAADDALGTQGQRLSTTVDDLIESRSKAAAPLYERLHSMSIDIDPTVAGIVRAADQLGALKAAKQLAAAKQVPFTLTEDFANNTGKFSMRDLDLVKQALDDIRYGPNGANAVTGKATKLGGAVSELTQSLNSHLDGVTNGAYKAARQTWEGPTKLMAAAQYGRSALSQDESAIAKTVATMSEAEQDAFRIGAFESLRAKMGVRAGQTNIMEMWREPAVQEKLKTIFGSERAYREFAGRVAAESRMKGLESVGRGSQTAARQYGAGDLDVQAGTAVGGLLADAKTGNLPGLLSHGADAWNRVATPEPVRDAMGRILLSQGAAGRSQLMDLQQVAREVAMARARQAGALGITGGTGSAGYGMLSNPDFANPADMNPLDRNRLH
jgi:hypothetical protein